MTTEIELGTDIEKRIHALNWSHLSEQLGEQGFATTAGVLTASECEQLAALFDGDSFRSTIDMARHRFGEGRYRYFSHPLPGLIQAARGTFYEHLAPVANRWADRLVGGHPTFPATHSGLLRRCRAAGQTRPTPLLLRYHAGDWNALHQDLYGEVYFPFQVLTVLSQTGSDFSGGEFVLLEQRPRAQSRAHVLTPAKGAFDLPDPRAAEPRQARIPPRRTTPRREHGHQRRADRARHHLPRLEMRTMSFTIYESPIGPLTVVAGEHGLRELHFPGRGPSKREDDQNPAVPALAAAAEQLDAYFAGELRSFQLVLELSGTAFQRRVWAALLEIPYGSTTTYGTIAREIALERGGRVVEPRAVGWAVGHTPIPIVIPCHRVIGADGSLTGFGGGLHVKRFLLEHEGALLPTG